MNEREMKNLESYPHGPLEAEVQRGLNELIEFKEDWDNFKKKWEKKIPPGEFRLHFTILGNMIDSL